MTLDTSGPGPIVLAPGDVDLVQETREGWGVAGDGGVTVALELELTPELRLERASRARWCAWSRTPGRRRAWT